MLQRSKLLALAGLLAALLAGGCASNRGATFATPDEAVRALIDAAEDAELAATLLGEGGFELLRSGDEVADQEDLEAVRAMARQKLAFAEGEDGSKVALLGEEGWELPIPLVRAGDGWRFDVEAGREEILARRVGRNELSTIATLRAIVEAQREYASEGRDGAPPAYARRLRSSEGRRDGLYWPVVEGEPQSPLGPLLAAAEAAGYERSSAGRVPYHGYFYRLLLEQGPNAPGGARSYLDGREQLTRGFAVLAWPATFGNSGVMSFLVNQNGIVFEKNLGPDGALAAEAMRSYDPDLSWTPVRD